MKTHTHTQRKVFQASFRPPPSPAMRVARYAAQGRGGGGEGEATNTFMFRFKWGSSFQFVVSWGEDSQDELVRDLPDRSLLAEKMMDVLSIFKFKSHKYKSYPN